MTLCIPSYPPGNTFWYSTTPKGDQDLIINTTVKVPYTFKHKNVIKLIIFLALHYNIILKLK